MSSSIPLSTADGFRLSWEGLGAMVSDEDLAAWQQRANAGELRTSDARRLLIALL
jgi:hypothetical protein